MSSQCSWVGKSLPRAHRSQHSSLPNTEERSARWNGVTFAYFGFGLAFVCLFESRVFVCLFVVKKPQNPYLQVRTTIFVHAATRVFVALFYY